MRKYTSAARMPLWKWILCLLGGLVIFMILYGLASMTRALPNPWMRMGAYVLCAGLGLFLYAVWCNLTERRPVLELPMNRFWKDLGLGLLLGVVIFGIVVGLMALADCYRISEIHFNPLGQAEWFLMFLMVAVFEEIIFRGVLFRLIDDRWNTFVALLVSAVLFGVMHLPNPGATLWSTAAIAIEAGLLLAAAYKWSGTLWVPIGIHWAWNYVQGNVFGLAVSGSKAGTTILATTVSGPDIITGGAFGPEASIIAVILGTFFTLVFLANRYRHTTPRH